MYRVLYPGMDDKRPGMVGILFLCFFNNRFNIDVCRLPQLEETNIAGFSGAGTLSAGKANRV
jgi:hypothetical protein